jgi:tetratricopeptide (TPR) repeat protein
MKLLNCFKKAMSLNPNYFDAFANYANLLTDLNKLDEALKTMSLLMKLNPKCRLYARKYIAYQNASLYLG